MKTLKIKKIFLLLIITIIVISCSKEKKSEEKILAKVGDKTISLNEFIRRAEYTIRPGYCKNQTNIDKKIILNSLIAEKLLSFEVGSDNEFLKRETVKQYLQGRKEQAMRQVLYKKEITDNIKIDKSLIDTTAKYVGREYDISYISVSDTLIAEQLAYEFLNRKANWEENLTQNYNLKKIPSRKVIWSNNENHKILDLLYTKNIKKGSIIGPLKFSDKHYMFLKINGWNTNKTVTQNQIETQIKNIKDVYIQRKSRIAYESYIRKLMKGKTIKFEEKTFFALADILSVVYMKSAKEKEELIKEGLWTYDKEQQKYNNVKPKLEEILMNPLYYINENKFTVSDFLKQLKIHPLVFREKKFQQKEFGFQLQMAIVDLVRDKYLTERAYEEKINEATEVLRDNYMWSDYLNSLNYKYEIIKNNNADSLYNSSSLSAIEEILNPIVDSLQQKYSAKIFIDTEMFNKIKLARIDMVVTYNNAPFSVVVPSFPIITNKNRLDYGNKMK